MDDFSSLCLHLIVAKVAKEWNKCVEGVVDLSMKIRLMDTLCPVSPRTQADIKEPSDATTFFETLKVFIELHPAILYGTNRPLTRNHCFG